MLNTRVKGQGDAKMRTWFSCLRT